MIMSTGDTNYSTNFVKLETSNDSSFPCIHNRFEDGLQLQQSLDELEFFRALQPLDTLVRRLLQLNHNNARNTKVWEQTLA